MQNKLLLATGNMGKAGEFSELLAELAGVKLLTFKDFPSIQSPAETGKSYSANARIKAVYYGSHFGLPVLADDSGLEVEYLNGAPGVHSARFLPGKAATDLDRCEYLVGQLKDFARPWTSRFVCSLVFRSPDGELMEWEGSCLGEVVDIPRGEGGFGYDPIFEITGLGKTMAEIDAEEKNRISHRARAVASALPDLREIFSLNSVDRSK